MSEPTFNNQNLAGILSEALGLEMGAGRAQFSSTSRLTLRKALDHESAPQTFGHLLATLEQLGSDEPTLAAVRKQAAADPALSLHDFANDYVREGRPE